MKIWKRISVSALLIMLLGIFSCEDPNGPGSEYTVTVTGRVVRLLNPSGIDSVVVTLNKPFRRDTVASDGFFSYSFTSKEDNEISAQFSLSHRNLSYYDTSYASVYSRTKTKVDLGEIKMRGKSASLDSQITGRPSFRPKVIAFIRSTFPLISILGAGNDVTSLFFEVRDSVGNPVDVNNKALVRFRLVSVPDNLVALNLASATTNSLGQVIVQLSAGQKAGIAQVQAIYIDTARVDTIKSPVVSVTIAGGLPVASRFSIGAQRVNVPGLVKYNVRNTISAMVGDTFGNPVQKGTIVYFSTNGGIIQPYATTNDDGSVSVDLITGNPAPPNGLAIITARVGTPGSPNTGGATTKKMDEAVVIKGLKNKKASNNSSASKISRITASSSLIIDTLKVLFTGKPIVRLRDPIVRVPHMGTLPIRFTVADTNGNPMSQGSVIKVTGIGMDTVGADITGDIQYTLPDTYDPSFTSFSISLKDKRTSNLDADIPIGFTIEVTGENGNIKETFWTLLSASGSSGGSVGSIAMDTASVGPLVVAGAGSQTSGTIKVKVRDTNNNPLKGIPLSFAMVQTVGGGEYLSSLSAISDSNGVASVILHSGIRSGFIQIQASYNAGATSIKSDIKTVYVKTGTIASISLVSVSSTSLSVKGGGGNESAILIFEAKDSLGNAIDGSNQATIALSLQGDTVGANINPSSVKTDPSTGRVTVNLTSGSKSGIILVTAKSGAVKSTSVQISVSGGQPVLSRFTLSTQKVNLPAGVQLNLANTITAVLGDTFGNPVHAGTVVYFSTNGGIIQPAATTSSAGLVSVNMVTSNPMPPGGIATIIAQVGTSTVAATGPKQMDESVVIKPLRAKLPKKEEKDVLPKAAVSVLSKSVNIVFSGAPIITPSVDTFTVDPTTPKAIKIVVADINGNPMAEGTTVRVTGVGLDTTGAVLSGNVNNTIPDTDDKNYTEFNILVADKRTKNLNKDVKIILDVEVAGPNGNRKKSIIGNLVAQGSAGGKVSSITMDTAVVGPLVVAGAGSPTSDTIKVRVLDANNNPSAGIPLSFNFVKTVDGGEYLSTLAATTNASGIAQVILHSGIRAGTVQVQASYESDETTVKSDIKSIRIKTGALASLHLISASTSSLSVKGGGGNETAVLIFEARDSLGNAIDGSNQTNVVLTLQGDTSGARVNPATVLTDPNTGRITTVLSSGLQSGIIQVTARSGSVSSSAIQISVSGGLPTQTQFTLSVPRKNYSLLTDKATNISVTAGDAYGNPAKTGTIISFKSNGGLIDANAATNSSGSATTVLQITNPQPPAGIATIEAKTFGIGGVVVRDTQTIVFSREAIITEVSGPYTNFEIEDGLSKTFQYRVADINGNPLAMGNFITVQASGAGAPNIVLTGDINVNTSDTKLVGVGSTLFTFTARDSVKDEGEGPKALTFKISVTGPNTSGTLIHSMNGTLKGGSGSGNEGNVASVTYLKSTKDTIFVANTSTPTTDTITFRVRSLNLQPVKNAAVQFFFTQSLNASEYLSPSYAVSDDSGDVKVVVHSGIKAGVIGVQAKVTAGNTVITSQSVPVYIKTGPLATIALISLSKNELSVNGVGGEDNSTVIFEARDLLGNPLDYANQTNIYFRIIGGSGSGESIKPDSAMTNPLTGRVTATLTSGSKSTVLQVVARNSSGTIKSTPVSLTIFGGFADSNKFYLSSQSGRNFSVIGGSSFPDYVNVNIAGKLGDKFGNPVKTGTAVYFSTTYGIIDASAFTDNGGNVSANLVIPTKNVSSLGVQTITARTVGENGDSVRKSIGILLTGAPVVSLTNFTNDTVVVNDGRDTTLNFTIADVNSNPISAGHAISFSATGDVTNELLFAGDVNITSDANKTNFSVNLRDLVPLAGKSGKFVITIRVSGTTGTTEKVFYGRLLAPDNSGGLPAQSQFTLSVPKKNYSILTDRSTTVSVIAGDALGNPAKSGTVITFKTTGGLIDASSTTGLTGSATANLQIVNPAPPSGIASIIANTVGAGGVVVGDTQTVVFSKDAVITEVGGPYSNFEIEDGLSKSFQFRVADVNGNPIAQGNTIAVSTYGTGSEKIVLSGDINITMPDTKLTGSGTTVFTFTARDTVKDEGQGPKPLGFKITVSGPNTSVPLNYSINGTLKGGTGSGNEGNVASVAYVSSSDDTIFVANAGTPTTDTITFKVKDLTQQGVSGAAVQFFFAQSLNASEYLSPSFAVSNDSGEVKVVVHSGIKAGVLKVEARVTAGASSISSQQIPVYVKTGPLYSISLISVERNELAVKGVGGNENTTVVYEARDMLGNPLDFANQTKLYFGFVGVAGNDADVNPDSAVTNPFTGRVSVNVSSGTRSTVLQVIARNSSNSIKSSPVPIVVHGGFTVDSLFTYTNFVRNISSKEKTPVTISMSLGDRYGNPVKTGTAVYFESSVGIINAFTTTNTQGIVQTTVTPAENLGLRKIIASTVGESGGSVNVLLKKELTVLMSGVPVITVPQDTVVLFDGGESTIDYKIADASNNPISSDHSVSVTLAGTVSSEVGLSGNQNFTTLDITDTSLTNFSLTLRDLLPLAGSGGVFTVTVTVDGVTGKISKSFYGKLYSPNNIVVPPSAREPAQIAFISSTATDLSIAGVGALENALLTYEVRDSLGVPIDKNKRTVATYSMQFFPNSFVGGGTAPRVIPTIDSTDDQGKLRLSVVSGTQAGNMQIVVRIQVGSNIITSQPVKVTIHAGFPDQDHFTIIQSAYSFLGNGLYNEIPFTVVVGDTFSNPVATGTAVYFHSQAGVMQTGASTFNAYTDISGKASVKLLTVNPKPDAAPYAYLPSAGTYQPLINGRPGYHWVYAQTQGKNGKQVTDSILVLQCAGPITTTGVPTATIAIAQGGSSADIPITIKDANGNPLPEGSSISVSIVDDVGIEFSVSGDLSSSRSTTISSGSIFPAAGVTDFTIKVNDLTSGGSPLNTSCTITINVVTPTTVGGAVPISLSKTLSFTAKVQ